MSGIGSINGLFTRLSPHLEKLASKADGRLLFHEQLVVLTPFTIEQALTNPAKAGARMPGIIELRFTDDPKLQGSYILYLQVEKIP
jgi:hypothetical protein